MNQSFVTCIIINLNVISLVVVFFLSFYTQTATNLATKISQAKKHPLTRGEALPIAKKKRMGKYWVAKKERCDHTAVCFLAFLRLTWLVFAQTLTDNSYCVELLLDFFWAHLKRHNLLATHFYLNLSDVPFPSETSTSSCDAANRPKNLKWPTTSQKALPAKTHRVGRFGLYHTVLLCRTFKPDCGGVCCAGALNGLVGSVTRTALYHMFPDASVPASTAETSTSSNAVSRVRALKQPVTSHRALLPKPQDHGKMGVPRCQNGGLMWPI